MCNGNVYWTRSERNVLDFFEVFGMFQHFSDFFRMKEKFTECFECPLHGVRVCVEEAPSDEAPRGHE